MDGNRNIVVTGGWSNPASRALYEAQWRDEPACRAAYEDGRQCGGCSFFAAFDADWGLCAHPQSRHRLETVFEHFTCPAQVPEGWGPHSFTADAEFHCLCGGEADYWRPLVEAARRAQDAEPDAAADAGCGSNPATTIPPTAGDFVRVDDDVVIDDEGNVEVNGTSRLPRPAE